ncbi:MAG: hypothetical protein A4E42_00200 [Methanoregulaceae archaeon PtaU1.Bin222]|nr:MAG: hypothetical protein A4E42_00200 [Methanoregulaceae archaeon PtaU1.Bin222]
MVGTERIELVEDIMAGDTGEELELGMGSLEPGLGKPPVGDVFGGPFESDNLAARAENPAGVDVQPYVFPVFPDVLNIHCPDCISPAYPLCNLVAIRRIGIQVTHGPDRLFHLIGRCIAEYPGKGWVDLDDAPVRGSAVDPQDGILKDIPVPGFACLECVFVPEQLLMVVPEFLLDGGQFFKGCSKVLVLPEQGLLHLPEFTDILDNADNAEERSVLVLEPA